MNVLLSAYACHPQRGSEDGIGWGWLKEVAKFANVWVLFDPGQGRLTAINDAVAKLPHRERIHPIAVELPKWLKLDGPLYRLRYEAWQWFAFREAKSLTSSVRFDLVHHVSLGTWWNCGYLWRLPVPFVFGPISGAQLAPLRLYRFLQLRDRLYEAIRAIAFVAAWRLWPRPRWAIRRAALVLVSNPETELLVRAIRRGQPTVLLSQNGVDSLEPPGTAGEGTTHELRLLYAGLLLPRKNFVLLLEALRLIPEAVKWSLRVVGDGPMRGVWQKQVQKAGLERQIVFHGHTDYEEMSAHYRWANVFVFPSLRDSTAKVVTEAMSHGLAVVALRIQGNTVLLDDESGVLIDVQDARSTTCSIRDALLHLSQDPAFRTGLGQAARERARRELMWENRGVNMCRLYREYALGPVGEPE